MKKKKFENIVNTASIYGYIANNPQCPVNYNASKLAVMGLTGSTSLSGLITEFVATMLL